MNVKVKRIHRWENPMLRKIVTKVRENTATTIHCSFSVSTFKDFGKIATSLHLTFSRCLQNLILLEYVKKWQRIIIKTVQNICSSITTPCIFRSYKQSKTTAIFLDFSWKFEILYQHSIEGSYLCFSLSYYWTNLDLLLFLEKLKEPKIKAFQLIYYSIAWKETLPSAWFCNLSRRISKSVYANSEVSL